MQQTKPAMHTKKQKRKSNKRSERPESAKTPKAPQKKAKVQETAIAIITEENSMIDRGGKPPVGQLAKSARCTQIWNKQNAQEAAATGGILQMAGEALTKEQTVASSGFTDLSQIRSAKLYTKTQQEVAQAQACVHLANVNKIRKAMKKRTVDMQMIALYQSIISSQNPKFAYITYLPEPVSLANTINNYMHLPETEEAKLKQLRKAIRSIASDEEPEFETREGLISFIRRYTDDDYFIEQDGVFKAV